LMLDWQGTAVVIGEREPRREMRSLLRHLRGLPGVPRLEETAGRTGSKTQVPSRRSQMRRLPDDRSSWVVSRGEMGKELQDSAVLECQEPEVLLRMHGIRFV